MGVPRRAAAGVKRDRDKGRPASTPHRNAPPARAGVAVRTPAFDKKKKAPAVAKAAAAPPPRSKKVMPAPPPATWRADYSIITQLRAARDAPVDSVGCERLADKNASRCDFEWQCLVSAMLSSQTKDQANAEAMASLAEHGNTIANVAASSVEALDKLIIKVGFHTTKAKNLREAANMCIRDHGGQVPRTLEGLLSLPGVGPKMAHLVMLAAFNQQEGICVDTHVHRIANALGWIETKTAEQTRIALESWLPRRHWPDVNVMLVGLGQQQQQMPRTLIKHCLATRSPVDALRLVERIGLNLRVPPGRWPELEEAARKRPKIRRLLLPESSS